MPRVPKFALLLVIAVLVYALGPGTSRWHILEPGPVLPAADLIGADSTGAPVRYPTVQAHTAGIWAALRCSTSPRCVAVESGPALVDPDSLRNAVTAAYTASLALAEAHDLTDTRGRLPAVTPSLPEALTAAEAAEVHGASAGLAVALHLLDAASAEQFLAGPGVRVSATGALDSDGRVLPVGGVPLKAAAVAGTGGGVLLVPTGSAPPRTAAGVQIVEVGSLRDAVTALCRRGAAGPLCERPAPSGR